MQISLVYDALKNNKLDVALGYTTDGKISAYDLVVLKDDKHFFSIWCKCSSTKWIITKRLQIKALINKLDHKINTEQMQKLNYEADGKDKAPAMIAKEFLEKNNYFDSDN